MKVLVAGATGQVGSAVIAELVRRGAQVRTFSRKPPAAGNFPDSVEVALGDLLDPESLQSALQGVTKLFLLNAVVPDELTQGLIAYGLAKRLKLEHVTYLSVFQADRFPDVPHFASKAAIERALGAFTIPYTILRPGYFFQNDLRLRAALTGPGLYPSPIGAAGIAAVDIRDIAEAAAITLTGSGHNGKTYNLVGPALLTGPGAAAVWSRALGKPIRYPGEDFDGWERQMRSFMPGWSAYDLRVMFQAYAERGFAATAADIAQVTALLGHAPRSYENLAADAAREWRASGAAS